MVNAVRTRVVRSLRALAAGALVASSVAVTVVSPAAAVTSVDTEAELRAAFASDSEIVVTADITLTDCDADDVLRTIDGPVTLIGNGNTLTQTCPDARVLRLSDPASALTVTDLTITGGSLTAAPVGDFFGAGLFSNGTVTLSGVTVTGNAIDATVAGAHYGGGVAVSGTLVLENSTVRGNVVAGPGPTCGGGGAAATTMTVTGSSIAENVADCDGSTVASALGGGLYVFGDLTLRDSVVGGNVAVSRAPTAAVSAGGGIFGEASATISGTRFLDNGAGTIESFVGGAYGGALSVTGRLEVRDSDFTTNDVSPDGCTQICEGAGGAIYAPGSARVTGSTIVENVVLVLASGLDADALASGGGVWAEDLEVVGSEVRANGAGTGVGADLAEADGGGLAATTMTVRDARVTGNRLETDGLALGGGLAGVGITVVDATVAANAIVGATAAPEVAAGGGIFVEGGSITGTTVSGNSVVATGFAAGGGIFHEADVVSGGSIGPGKAGTDRLGRLGRDRTPFAPGAGRPAPAVPEPAVYGLTVVDSTVVDNRVGPDAIVSIGGGIAEETGTAGLSLVYVTLAGNAARVGANLDEVPEEVEGAGGVAPLAPVPSGIELFGTVLADPVGGGNCSDLEVFTSLGYNYSTDASCPFAAVGDVVGGADPGLGALADNGGPTLTRLPARTSPLVDAIPVDRCQAATAAGVTTDQRGVARPQIGGCDIGAVEVALVPTFTG